MKASLRLRLVALSPTDFSERTGLLWKDRRLASEESDPQEADKCQTRGVPIATPTS